MTASGRGLIGSAIRIGNASIARVTGALIDATGQAVLLRVATADEVAYVPRAALESPSSGVIRVSGPHVLLRRSEITFYEDGALEWIPVADVSGGRRAGMVGH